MTAPGILWLTRDFRFKDNPALLAAIKRGPLLPVFFIDRLLMAQGAASRWRLERALFSFDAELRRRTGGAGVTILRGEPDLLLGELADRTGARQVHQSDWPAPDMRSLQDRVRAALQRHGKELVLHPGHLLVHPQLVRTQEGGCYRVFTPFARALRFVGPDRPAREAPGQIRPYRVTEGADLAGLDLAPDLHRGRSVLESFALPAGEAAAHDRLDAFLDGISGYAGNRDRPDIDATSGLSEHLAVGEISPRTIWTIARMRAEAEPARAADIEKFLSEVIWREFAWHLLLDFPHMTTTAWREGWADFPWREANDDSRKWCRGETGMALVDAGLREMRVTGRMHNRVRMVVASWLTKHLLTDWRLGLSHFADSLTDWDPASNAMNWQWVAGCGPDAAPYFRIFNPEKQAEQHDPEGRYRSRWLAGWMGTPSAEAQAYLESAPSAWKLSQVWNAGGAVTVKSGRELALQAYADFRTQQHET
jgi:deoxyribodipyrimidine photo-lyase